jgi:pimeloyl-ACP methyl ester carboxylesterase
MDVTKVDIGEMTLSVAEAGAGGRPLLLVHGFTGAKEDFTALVDPLAARGWHAVTFDLRGHGSSDAPAGADAYALAAFVGDTLGLADALGWERFALVGHSMGGAVAQRLVLDHPGRVGALALVSTFHGPLEIDPDLVALGVAIVTQGGMPALATALAAQRRSDPAALAARARMEEARPGYEAWADTKLTSCSRDMWLAMAPRFPAWPDTLGELRAAGLDMPVLVVVGSEDETMRAQCEELAAAIPGARLVVMDGLRHSPQLEAPDAFLDVLVSFLGANAPGGDAPG